MLLLSQLCKWTGSFITIVDRECFFAKNSLFWKISWYLISITCTNNNIGHPYVRKN